MKKVDPLDDEVIEAEDVTPIKDKAESNELVMHEPSPNSLNLHTKNSQTMHESEAKFSMIMVMFLAVAIFIVWANFFEIDAAVKASGKVIPTARTQIVQVADGGVLAELLVEEGQYVQEGERLAVLEKIRANASFEGVRADAAAINAALTRAVAESQKKAPIFGPEFDEYNEFVLAQTRLYIQRKKTLTDRLMSLDKSRDLAQQEFSMYEDLFSTGDSSRLEVMRAEKQLSELEGEVLAVNNKYMEDARLEVSKLKAELSNTLYKLDEKSDFLQHTDIFAPQTGIVKHLKMNTVGGVLRSGDELMQISPTESILVVEVHLSPADIGQLSLGLPTTVSLGAFDYTIYGSIEGELTYMSSDTLTEKGPDGRDETYYRAHITIADEYRQINPKFKGLDLKPGMTADINIMTDRRSIITYLSKPITRAFGGALTEK